jgi:cytochrome P450
MEVVVGLAKLPPGPKWVVFKFLQILKDPLDFATGWAREYGDVIYFRFGTMKIYVLNHPDAIEQVLRHDHRNFIKDSGTRMLSSFLGQGLLTSEGELWRRQRRLAQPAFQVDQIQKYSEVMVSFTERMLRNWRVGQTRDIHADMMRLTLEIVAQTLFSASVEGKADVVGHAMEVIMEYFAGPMALVPRLLWLPTPGNIRYRRALKELNQVIYDTIAGRRANGREDNDFLSRLLAARDEDGSQMSDEQLRDEVVTLFLAGHETTALALSFTFYLLAQHPEVESRLAAELEEVLAGRLPVAADVPRLRYTEWVIRESMRLYPPAPGIGREAVNECEIAGYRVPKGAQIALLQWVVHRDPRWFEGPDVFKPERWDNDLAKRLPRCAYFPFGDGPRICIGNQFAMMEAILILATIAQRFRLKLAPGFALELLPSITLRPKRGVRMVIEERGGTKQDSGSQPALATLTAAQRLRSLAAEPD